MYKLIALEWYFLSLHCADSKVLHEGRFQIYFLVVIWSLHADNEPSDPLSKTQMFLALASRIYSAK